MSASKLITTAPVATKHVDYRDNPNDAPVIHLGQDGVPVQLIYGKNDEAVRYAAEVYSDLISDTQKEADHE